MRRVLLVTHPARTDVPALAEDLVSRLAADGVEVVRATQEHYEGVHDGTDLRGVELVVVLGGDGTILRGAEFSRAADVPLLGVNLGRVGFLAEVEREEMSEVVDHIVARNYTVEERMTLEVDAYRDGDVVCRTWALNEASVEKSARERMLELTVEVDGRPLSTWGADGVVISTPTGSTAYAFSAGGPVVWPDVEAMLLVPLSAHALFARPLVVGPSSQLAVEIIPDTEGVGVVWADGRRTQELPPGARLEVRTSPDPVRFARLSSAPFTDRLVAKFDLSVHGWRGRGRGSAR